jgi:hypothetical protein
MFLGKLCLPPKTRLEISRDTLSLTNSFCQLVFKAEHPAHFILNVHPTERHYVDLGNGEPRYEIRQMGISVQTTFYALRSQNRKSAEYHEWTNRVVDGARRWFSPGNPLGQPQVLKEPPAG